MMEQIRDVTINIHATQSQGDLIDYAAAIHGKSGSEFILEAAYQKAQDVLFDRRFFALDKQKFEQFAALLDSLPAPNDKLHELLKTKAPWE
ncbi:DUF1778 domain-containing protein [Leptolyngbya sp. AN03gr2]|uniref:type II toxin-antitoxin system TacA family antitoxin n=1 Tax=unclassified Leptolyngbya TaxID=2650499 RepID=UPI003D312311